MSLMNLLTLTKNCVGKSVMYSRVRAHSARTHPGKNKHNGVRDNEGSWRSMHVLKTDSNKQILLITCFINTTVHIQFFTQINF